MKTPRTLIKQLMPLVAILALTAVDGAGTATPTTAEAGVIAPEKVNLLKNSEFVFDSNGKLSDWGGNSQFSQDLGFKSKNSVRFALEHQSKLFIQNYITQRVQGLKPGKYIFTANVKLDRKISDLVLLGFYQAGGENVYQGPHLKASEQPAPGAWGKVMAEFNIPEGIDVATFAIDLRDGAPGATVWVDSPVLIYKTEQ